MTSEVTELLDARVPQRILGSVTDEGIEDARHLQGGIGESPWSTFRRIPKYPIRPSFEEAHDMQEHICNAIGHFDIAGPDAELLGLFYSNVFGWRVDAQGPGYALIDTPQGTPGGAIIEAEEAALTIGVVVPDLDRAVAAAAANGGDIAMPPTDNGWVRKGVLVDPAGNHVTVIQA